MVELADQDSCVPRVAALPTARDPRSTIEEEVTAVNFCTAGAMENCVVMLRMPPHSSRMRVELGSNDHLGNAINVVD